MSEKIQKVGGNTRVAHVGASAFVMGDMPLNTFDTWVKMSKNVDWESDPSFINGVRIVPHGANNDLPTQIRNIMDQNNLAPGILEREIGLLHGDGPALYQLKFEDGFMVREYVQDPEIQAWLDTWNYRRYIDMATVEYKYMKGIYTKVFRNRGPRIGNTAKINRLECVPSTDGRLGWPEDPAPKRLEYVKWIHVGDFENHCLHTGIVSYPKYDPYNPFKYGVALDYDNSYSFGRNFYSVPSYYGSLNWIMRSSDIPEVLRYLSENGITSAFHIHTPGLYWDKKLERIEKMYPEESGPQHEKRLEELKDQTFKSMAATLTGKRNAGKFIETVDFYDEEADEIVSWKVESIDQKVKDFIEAQLKISEKADSATTSGMGLHPSLSNIIVNGQLSSGSQMLYALKLYLASDTTIPEEVIFLKLNQAIKANWPDKRVRMGFYHNPVEKEENVAPEKRVVKTADAEK